MWRTGKLDEIEDWKVMTFTFTWPRRYDGVSGGEEMMIA